MPDARRTRSRWPAAAAVAVVAIWLLVAALLVYVASGALGYR